MRPLIRVLVLASLVMPFVACTGLLSPAPSHERSNYYYGPVEPPFSEMDLPYYGGIIEYSSATHLKVVYVQDDPSPRQLKRYWSEAAREAGWTIEREADYPDGSYMASFDTPEQGTGHLTVEPLGSAWRVVLTF